MIISSHGSKERNSWVKMNVGTRFGKAGFKNLRERVARIINHDFFRKVEDSPIKKLTSFCTCK